MKKSINRTTGYILLLITAILLFILSYCSADNIKVQDGDIVFQTLDSPQSKAIKLATKSKYSHVGLVLFKNGKPYVLEAVGPVKYTPLKKWTDQGEENHCVIKRLKKADSLLTMKALNKIRSIAATFEGKRYDFQFNWGDDKIYCSELVWKIYYRALGLQVGKLQRLKDFDLSSPTVKKIIQERYGSNIPFDEAVISPEAMFESDLLETVQVVN